MVSTECAPEASTRSCTRGATVMPLLLGLPPPPEQPDGSSQVGPRDANTALKRGENELTDRAADVTIQYMARDHKHVRRVSGSALADHVMPPAYTARLLGTVRRVGRHESAEALHLRRRRLRGPRAELGQQRGAREEDVGRQVIGGWRWHRLDLVRLRGTSRGFAGARALPRRRGREARLLAPCLAGDRLRRRRSGRRLSLAAPKAGRIVGGAVVVELVRLRVYRVRVRVRVP